EDRIKIGEIIADWPLPAQERLPVILEIRVIHADGEGLRLDILQRGVMEQGRQPAGNGNRVGEQMIAGDTGLGIDCDCGIPEHALKYEAAARVPHDRCNSPPGSRHATHFTQRELWLWNEEKNEMRGHGGEATVLVFESAGIAYFEARPLAGPARLGIGYEG